MELPLQSTSNFQDIVEKINLQMKVYEDKLLKLTPASTSELSDLAALKSEFFNFKSFVLETFSLFKTQLELLSLGLDRHEVFIRRNVLLFHNIPENSKETPIDLATKLIVDTLSLPEITSNNIEVCHRLGVSQGKPRPLLVKFTNYNCRQLVWSNKTALRGSGQIITEFLTKTRHQVFMEARKYYGMKNCWSSDGKIIILLPNKSRHKIELMSELQTLIQHHPLQVSKPPPAQKAAKSPKRPKRK